MISLGLSRQIPHAFLSLIGAGNCPGVPLAGISDLLDTLVRLAGREIEVEQAKKGLTNTYTIGGTTARAIQFLSGTGLRSGAFANLKVLLESDPASALKLLIEQQHSAMSILAHAPAGALTALPLESAPQWSISWTNYAGVYERAVPPAPTEKLTEFSAALDPTDPAAASRLFWPTIAGYGLGYNLLILEKVRGQQLGQLQALFGAAWISAWDAAAGQGLLYAIDLRIFEQVPADETNKRFTPATVTLLVQDPATRDLTAVAVRVTAQNGGQSQVYVEQSPAWLYGLQAARTSVTVYGIWLGHVYHWHMVTAAMLLAAGEALPGSDGATPAHPVRQLLDPQSQYLVAFDEVLLLLWAEVAPPTSVSNHWDFLRLMSRFATGRGYFMDDPKATLDRNGITATDFSTTAPWDRYPIVRTYLAVWEATAAYVAAFVDHTYGPTNPPSEDAALQAWMQSAADANVGNLSGLPGGITTTDELKQVLTSLVYRITMHGAARLLSTANPGLTFVANFPPCLQQLTIPAPTQPLTPKTLFEYLPRTGTIGGMVKFYYTFSFSRPYEPFVPEYGLDSRLFFPGGTTDPRNQALVAYRQAIQSLIDDLSPVSPPTESQRYQWPLSIET
jgi:hypothetical protein